MMSSSDLDLSEERMKLQQEEIAENNVDFLSNLPEALTSHILSLLSTKDAVRTSMLSKYWEYQWTKIINLSFDDQFLNASDITRKENFMSFVDRVLLLLENPVIERFTLTGMDYYVASKIHEWISTAIRRHVRKLIISCLVDGLLVFPRCIYYTTSLIEMDLELSCTFDVPTNVCFSSLKILHLSKVRFRNEDHSNLIELTLCFPKLQEVKLYRCRWLAIIINIDAPELSSCTIAENERDYRRAKIMVHSDVKIYAPNLCKFKCESFLTVQIIFIDPSSIVDASIGIYTSFRNIFPTIAILACGLLEQLRGVKHLTLSRRTISILCSQEDLDDMMVTFDNPLHLTITGGIPAIGQLEKLLRRLPGLLSLSFTNENPIGGLGYLPRCSLPNLKVVKLLSFCGSGSELDLAKFILMNATALEEMIVTCIENLQMDTERVEEVVTEDLQTVEWASTRVSITIVRKYLA